MMAMIRMVNTKVVTLSRCFFEPPMCREEHQLHQQLGHTRTTTPASAMPRGTVPSHHEAERTEGQDQRDREADQVGLQAAVIGVAVVLGGNRVRHQRAPSR